jgi:hypothetical protein
MNDNNFQFSSTMYSLLIIFRIYLSFFNIAATVYQIRSHDVSTICSVQEAARVLNSKWHCTMVQLAEHLPQCSPRSPYQCTWKSSHIHDMRALISFFFNGCSRGACTKSEKMCHPMESVRARAVSDRQYMYRVVVLAPLLRLILYMCSGSHWARKVCYENNFSLQFLHRHVVTISLPRQRTLYKD